MSESLMADGSTVGGAGSSFLFFGLSFWQLLLILWSLAAATVVLLIVYVVFFLDNINGNGAGLPTNKVQAFAFVYFSVAHSSIFVSTRHRYDLVLITSLVLFPLGLPISPNL